MKYSFVILFLLTLGNASLGSTKAYACPDINGLVDHNCDRQLLIICFGDSITAGVADETGLGYPGWLQILLPEASILNAGISGERTPTGKQRSAGVFSSLAHPDYIIILEGVNDYWLNTSSVSTKNNLALIKQFAENVGAIPLLGTLTFVNRGFQIGWVNSVNNQIRSFSEIDFFALGPGILSSDRLHPNAAGYQQMANLAKSRLENLGSINRPLDTDSDGIYDFAENFFGSSPINPDSDGDGLLDGIEVFTHSSSPVLLDSDGDGYSDPDEVNLLGSDPSNPKPGPPEISNFEVLERD